MENTKTGIYIDGLNFYYGALRNSTNKWLNIQAFAQLLVPNDDISVIRYFTAPINARPSDPRITTRQSTYFRALETLPLVQIHKGRFTSRVTPKALADSVVKPSELFTPPFLPNFVYNAMWKNKVNRRTGSATIAKVVIDEEKESDVNLGVHLVNDAARGIINKAIVISNDSDLREAIKISTSFGITVGIVNPHPGPTSKHLKSVSQFEIQLRRESFVKCQFPATVKDHRGRDISRPREWR